MGTTWLSQTGGARLLPDSEGPMQELDPQDPVTQCTAGAGSQTNLMIPEAATSTPVISTSISKMLYYFEENKRTFR